MGKLCIEVTPNDKIAAISEELCIGCGICVKVRFFCWLPRPLIFAYNIWTRSPICVFDTSSESWINSLSDEVYHIAIAWLEQKLQGFKFEFEKIPSERGSLVKI